MAPIILWSLLTAAANGFAATRLAPQKFGKKTTCLIWTLYAAAIVAVTTVNLVRRQPAGSFGGILGMILTAALHIAVFMLTAKGRTDVRLFLILSYTALQSSCAGLMEYMTAFVFSSNLTAGLIFYAALMAAVLYVLMKKLLPAFQEAAAVVKERWNIMSILIGLFILTIATYYVFPNRMRDFTFPQAASFPLTVILFFICLNGLIISLRNSVVTAKNQLASAQIMLLSQQIESQHRITEEIRKSRHDLRHHNCILTAYAEKGDLQGLLQYLNQQNVISEAEHERYYCENETINTILQVYGEKARAQEIKVTAFAEADREIPIPAPDLVAIIANLFENAINGVLESGSDNPEILVRIHTKAGRLVISMDNPCVAALHFSGAVPLELQGIGICSILSTAAKNGGECNFSAADGRFSAVVLIDLAS